MKAEIARWTLFVVAIMATIIVVTSPLWIGIVMIKVDDGTNPYASHQLFVLGLAMIVISFPVMAILTIMIARECLTAFSYLLVTMPVVVPTTMVVWSIRLVRWLEKKPPKKFYLKVMFLSWYHWYRDKIWH